MCLATSKAWGTITNNTNHRKRKSRDGNRGAMHDGNDGGSSGGSGDDEGGRKGRLPKDESLKRKDEKTEVIEQATKCYSNGNNGETHKDYYYYKPSKIWRDCSVTY